MKTAEKTTKNWFAAMRENRKRKWAARRSAEDYIPLKRKCSNFGFLLRMAFRYEPVYMTCEILSQLVMGILQQTLSLYYLVWVIRQLENSTDAAATFRTVVIGSLIAFAIWLICYILKAVTVIWNGRASIRIQKRMHSMLFEKAINLELEKYDDPKFYNDFIWANNNASSLVLDAMKQMSQAVYVLSSIIVAGNFILLNDYWMIGFVFLAIAVSTSLTVWQDKVNYKYNLELNPKLVKRDYVNRVFYVPECGKELKLTHVGTLLVRKYTAYLEEIKALVRKHGRKMSVICACGGLAWDILFHAAVLFYLAYKVIVAAAYPISRFMGLYEAATNFYDMVSWFVSLFPQINAKSMFAHNFRQFMEYTPQMTDEPDALDCPEKPGVLEIRNVSYTYAGADKPALSGINMTIRPGKKIAFVGYNGAGKSTLVKLIMRLYDPTEGQILYDGVDIRRYKLSAYRRLFGSVFQDFQLFAASVAENVKMDCVTPEDIPDLEQALTLSGGMEKVMSLERGMDTQLTREFSDQGVNLSGGEAQKVAIARIFAKDCAMLILDEPSSALDPMSEYELNCSMQAAAGNKAVVFISHRLSATRTADCIYMMEKGRIVEQGSHDALMEQAGKYAEMFILQASSYLEEVS